MSPARERPIAAELLLLCAPVWVVALRQALPELLGWSGLAPDLLLLAAAVGAWRHAPAPAVLFAAAGATLLDVPSAVPFGLAAGRLAVCTALFASLRGGLRAELPGVGVVVVAAFALLERLLQLLTLWAFQPDLALSPLLARAGAVALVTGLMAPLGFAVSRALRPPPPRGRP